MIFDQKVFERISKRIESWSEEMIKLQVGLTAIPAISPLSGGDGELGKALYLQTVLNDMGFKDIKRLDAPDSAAEAGFRPNIIAQVRGVKPHPATWVLTHLDIVPPGEASLWSQDPYQAKIQDGRIFGRGVVDNQQDMVASIFAARAFIEEGINPTRSIGLAFVADEETGSSKGLSYLLENTDHPFHQSDLIIVPDAGNEDGTMIEIAEKSMLWLKFKTIGKQCHGSRPSQGNNAFVAASHLVVKLNELYQIFGDKDGLYEPPISTFEPTKKEANVPNINTIPGDDVFYMDSRILPHYPLTQVKETIHKMADEIEKKFRVTVEIATISEGQAPAPTAFDAPVVLALKDAIKDIYNREASPLGIGGGTVAAFFRRHGYQAAVWSRNTCTAHQPDENCLIEDMVENAKVFAHIFLRTVDS